MASVITFSKKFPASHQKAGQPTLFVHQIINSLKMAVDDNYLDWLFTNNPFIEKDKIREFWHDLKANPTADTKIHTIRVGKSRKKGYPISLRVWMDKAYRSPQIIFAPEQTIKSLYDFKITSSGVVSVDGQAIEDIPKLAFGDGLTEVDFWDWFAPTAQKFEGFDGQLIGWEEVQY